jgi:ABC-2 type transport system ATP-binding protein
LIGYLTAEEYFYFIGDLRHQNKADVQALLAKYEEFFNGEILNKKKYLRDLSKGNQKKVGIIATLIGNPEVIIFDEPFANLDPTTVNRLKRIIKELADNPAVTILVSSHDLQHTVEVCDRIVALHKGELVKDINTSAETLQELEAFFAV